MNTTPTTPQFTRILDSSGRIGEILFTAPKVVIHEEAGNRHQYAGQSGDSLSPGRPIAACSRFGQWILFVGPKSISTLMTSAIVGIAQHEDVRVLDCGYQYDEELGRHLTRGNSEEFQHIKLKNAHTPGEVLYILDHASSVPVPFVLLDLLHPFYDRTISIDERKENLLGCMQNIRRLEVTTGGMVSICPPAREEKEAARELFRIVQKEAKSTFDVQIMYPGWEM
jgi:hypothetical protein